MYCSIHSKYFKWHPFGKEENPIISRNKKTLPFLGIFFAVWLFARFLLPLIFPFLLGLGLALCAQPGVKFLVKRFRLPRILASGLGVSLTFFSLTGVILLALAALVRLLQYLGGVLPDLEQTARAGVQLLEGWLLGLTERFPQGIGSLLRQNIAGLFSGGTALVNKFLQYIVGLAGNLLTHIPDSALTLGTAFVSAYMISARLDRIRRWLEKQFPREKLRPLLQTLHRVRAALTGWLTAQLKLSMLTFGILTAGFLLLRIPHGILWALAVAALDAFPVLGTGTALLPWALICFLQGNLPRAIGLVSTYTVVTLLRSALEPKLVGHQLGLDSLVTLISVYAGYRLWGIGGMILAPLLTATVLQLVPERTER